MTLTASLALTIERDGEPTVYWLRRLSADPLIASKVWRLTRADGLGEYDVALFDGFPSCTCGSMVWTRENHGDVCKHFWACQERGLMQ